jgi:Mg2+ and Co2+ transporter CorA
MNGGKLSVINKKQKAEKYTLLSEMYTVLFKKILVTFLNTKMCVFKTLNLRIQNCVRFSILCVFQISLCAFQVDP